MSSNIYTKGGDTGMTSLADGSRVSKASIRVDTYGTIDEANSWIGAAKAFVKSSLINEMLEFLGHRFYNCSSNIAASSSSSVDAMSVSEADVKTLERFIDQLEKLSGPIKGFVIPSGSRAASLLHVARTVCRRAERLLCALNESEPVDPSVLKFINRSSDLLFAAARCANKVDQSGDILWNKDFPVPR